MRIKIKFGGPLKDEIGSQKIIEIPGQKSITLEEFRSCIQAQPWADKVLKDGYVASPVILIIDEQLIQFSQNSENNITKNSQIRFQIMFAGG